MHDFRLFTIERLYQCNDMSGKSHVIEYVKHLNVANAVKSLAIVNENYKCSFTHYNRLLNNVLDAT